MKYFFQKIFFVFTFSFLFSIQIFSQFYNGHQMKFGKNRLQYNDFVWQYYRSKKFDVYFYQDGQQFANFVYNVAKEHIYDLEYFFQYEMKKKLQIIVYNKLTDFRQSNIGLKSSSDEYNIGGTTQVVDNKLFVYYPGNKKEFEKQIRENISKVFLNEVLFGASFKSRIANTTLMSFPPWFLDGLASYLSEEWSVQIDNKVRDGILSERFMYFNSLTGDEAKIAGHSIWFFIAKKYGKNTIPNIIYITKLSKNSESGFYFVLGLSMKYLSMEWYNFFDEMYYKDNLRRNKIDFENAIKKVKKSRKYSHFIINPVDSTKVAYVTNELGKVKIYIEDIETKKRIKVVRRGHKLQQIVDFTNPVIAWHPSGTILAYTDEYKGKVMFYLFDLETKKTDLRVLVGVDKVLSMNYSKKGFNIVMSVVRNGNTDIVVYNVVGNTFVNITEDVADDLNPVFVDNDKNIIFSSNRKKPINPANEDTLLQKNYDLFLANFKGKPISKLSKLTAITKTPLSNETSALQIGNNKYFHLSDSLGIVNFMVSKYDSTISFIDTSIHYRYFTTTYPVSNFERNVEEFNYVGRDKIATIFFKNGKNVLPFLKSSEYFDAVAVKAETTHFKKQLLKSEAIKKKKKQIEKQIDTTRYLLDHYPRIDTSNIDINNYIFTISSERINSVVLSNSHNLDTITEKDKKERKPFLYFTSFYNNYVVNQIDFGFLNTSYQAFTGNAIYFNPGLNVLFKIGALDLFENYRITSGFRFSGNFESNEYLLSFENLKKLVDKQWVFHRQSYLNVNDYELIRTHSHNLMYILKYPFSQVSAARLTLSGRYDRNVTLSTDIQTLHKEPVYNFWESIKAEYIFDNTFNLALNLYSGIRAKIFIEAYNKLLEKKTDLYIVGFDFRHYTKIHKNLILANRVAGSKSFGNKLLIYYLGGVDNWINLSNRVPMFDVETPIDYTQPYVFQALATNMRGFIQNARNGTTFLLSNNEIRWPFVSYFSRRPINSDFFRSLQLVLFCDVGSAWSGPSPESKENKYNSEVIQNGPITVILEKDRAPVIFGYGWGLRARLLGYFIRADWAWGVDGDILLPKVFYLSFSLDF